MNMLDFTGRKALVTGGSQGIGRAVVERLLKAGAEVRFWSLDIARQDRVRSELGGPLNQLTVDVVDVCQELSVGMGAKRALEHLGWIDILINNVGAFGPVKPMLEYSLEEWEKVLWVNLTSQFLVSRAVIPQMVERGYGRVVNLASVVGRDANPNAPAYSAAKAGVIRLTQALGRSLAKTGVLVNCVAPAATRTAFFNGVSKEYLDRMLAQVPMGRFGEVQDVAALICWLASEDCSYCTGAVFDCSGGRHE